VWLRFGWAPELRLRLRRPLEGRALVSVHVEEVTSTVDTEAPPPGAASAPDQPASDEADWSQRDMLRRLARDRSRTRSEAYDD
jgi:hypothetical protein